MKLKEKKLFLLDMDGTIYFDNTLFPGTLDFLRTVKERGGRYLFLTNNSSKGVDSYIEKLAHMGIRAVREDFVTSVEATVSFLRERYQMQTRQRKIYVLGTESFKAQMV